MRCEEGQSIGHHIRFDPPRATTGADATVAGSSPYFSTGIGRANGKSIHKIRRNLHACVSRFVIEVAVVADGDCENGVPIGKVLMEP